MVRFVSRQNEWANHTQETPLAVTNSLVFVVFTGVVGCSVTACIEKCSYCESAVLKYYDGAWMRNRSSSTHSDEKSCAEGGDDNLAHDDEPPDEVGILINLVS